MLTHVKFGFPPPLLGTHWCEVLSRDDGGVEEGFHGVIKDQVYFALTWNKGVENGWVYEQPDGRSDNELLRGDEWRKCGDCSEMRRLKVQGDLFECLSVLADRPSADETLQEQWDVRRSRQAIRRPRRTSLPVRRSGPGVSGGSLTGS